MAKISSVEGNRQWLDGGSMFGNAPRAVWERWSPPDSKGRIELACRALLIETDEHKILCETGIGAFFEPKMAERFGVQTPGTHQLLKNLKSLGANEQDIDFVILSHLHFDHAGGLLPTYNEIQNGDDQLLFSNAKYVVGEEAFERAKYPHIRDRASFIPGMVEKLEASGRLHIVKELSPEGLPQGIGFIESHGHTPGQLHTIYKGANQSVFYAGDLIPGQAWVHLPITMGYDRYPELLIDEKQSLYQQAVPSDWLIFFTHDPVVSACTIEKDDKHRYTAKDKIEKLTQYEI